MKHCKDNMLPFPLSVLHLDKLNYTVLSLNHSYLHRPGSGSSTYVPTSIFNKYGAEAHPLLFFQLADTVKCR